MCVSDCMVFKYAPSSKITRTCLFLSYYSLLIIWHAVQCFCYHLFVFSILYFYTWIIMMLKHRSNVQGNKEFQTGNRSLINLFQLNAYQKASMSQQSSVYCWSRKQTWKRRWISGFCRSIIFFGIENVRVGGKILGSVDQKPIFFFGLSII